MTTVRPAPATRRAHAVRPAGETRPRITAGEGITGGGRHRRRHQRRRVIREEVLALAVLAAVLAVTLVLLGLQWLGHGTTSVPAGLVLVSHTLLGGSA